MWPFDLSCANTSRFISGKEHQPVQQFTSNLIGHFIPFPVFRVTQRRSDRQQNHNPVNAVIEANAGKLQNWSTENQALRLVKDPEIVQIRIRYFVGNDFPKWIEDIFRILREKGTKNLIVDL